MNELEFVRRLEALEEAVARIVDSQTTARATWAPTSKAAEVLGVSIEQLRTLANSEMKEGFHYRVTSKAGAARLHRQFHIRRCSQYLASPVDKRQPA